MITEQMEVFSLEEGDTISHLGGLYLITSFENNEDGSIRINCVDEEGYRRSIHASGAFDKVNLVCD
jgi:hypothetical protein